MNRLGEETSPYLRQHRDNPVDWYPWGEEAFALARQTDRPIFVSIGYAACHWCHVMAHESFEDEAVARLLNERFVSIKVDREERPEIDAIYLEAVQALTGSGGWPLSVFLDHERKPFFGGTYFPPRDAHGLPSFTKLLDAIATAWTERRADLLAQSEEITNVIAERLAPARSASEISATEVDTLFSAAIESYAARFDTVHGGLGAAPKFPQPPMLELLCEGAARDESGAREMLEATLLSMASGGIYDQIGGGFARYSVDRAWLVPHFEKMLYDQAGLARVYLHAFELTGDARYRQVVEESLDYVLRDLRLPDGGIASSEDADSEGEEGLFYLWDLEQLQALLGDRAEEAAAFYGVTKSGNFEGRNILHVAERGAIERSPEIEAARQILFAARTNRVRPGLDDKVITEWNAMIAGALAEAGGALSHPGYRQAAIEIAEFCWTNLRDTSGRVMRSWQDGRARHLGTANDYAWLIDCFTRLYEATGEDEWLGRAEVLAQDLIELFSAEDGAFFLAGSDGESLIVRPQDSHDGVVPAAGSIATSALARLGALVSDGQLIARAERALGARSVLLKSVPLAVPHLLQAARSLVRGSVEVVVSGELPELVSLLQASYLPGSVLAWGIPSPRPLWEGRESPGAYVCRRGVCELPVQAPTELIAALDAATSR